MVLGCRRNNDLALVPQVGLVGVIQLVVSHDRVQALDVVVAAF